MADIHSTLRKIKSLADGTPFEFEKESALQHLQMLMEKHGISENDLNDEAVTTRKFFYKSKRERSILIQIMEKVFAGKYKTYFYQRRGHTLQIVGVDCTASQKIEVDFLYSFYKALYRKEEKLFFTGFIHKHSLFRPTNPDEEAGSMDEDEYLKMLQMMEGMENATPHKQIAERRNDR